MQPYLNRQKITEPLYPDLLWSRPENKRQAGKLLIIGGNAQGFSAAAEAYNESTKAGIGTARVILPNVLQRTVSKIFPAAEYAPSTPSGSFSQQALAELLAEAHWADGVLLAGDLGRNSETAILLENFTSKYSGQLTITRDAADYFTKLPQPLLMRPNSLMVISLSQLQKLGSSAKLASAITFDMDLIRLADVLHKFTSDNPISIMTKKLDNLIIASGGEVSFTKLNEDKKVWRLKAASHASVWWLQNPNFTYKALTTSLVDNLEQ
jgi:hypothetical protein